MWVLPIIMDYILFSSICYKVPGICFTKLCFSSIYSILFLFVKIIFTWELSMNKTYASGRCDIELKNGDLCGIPAIGRCATCGRAFCSTHQAGSYNSLYGSWVPYVDLCTPCFA